VATECELTALRRGSSWHIVSDASLYPSAAAIRPHRPIKRGADRTSAVGVPPRSAAKTAPAKRRFLMMPAQMVRQFRCLLVLLPNLRRYFVSMGDDELLASAAFGESTNVSHTLKPSGLALLSNSP
jgi:hypothetical protein